MNSALSLRLSRCVVSKNTAIAVVVIVAALLLRFLFAWTSLANLPATSDEASAVLLAKMIARGELPLLFLGQPYQFPIEAYLMAPFVDWLPRNAFGARYQAMALGLLSVYGSLLIVRAAFPPKARWPAALLVLFPSAYLLLLTSAYALPQYSMAITLAWISIFLALKTRHVPHKRYLPVLTGLACGLAFSNHLLTVTVTAGVFALILFGGSARRALRDVLCFGAGFLVGVIPYLLAIWLKPGAYEGLPTAIHLAQALPRLVDPVLLESFPGAMGFDPSLFPDFKAHLGWPHSLRTTFAVGYTLLLGFLLVRRAKTIIRAIAARRWPTLELVDLALITSILAFGLFAYHTIAPIYYRYLLPAVWCFPFLVGYAFMALQSRWRAIIGGVAVVLVAFNIAASAAVIKEWSKPGLIEEYSDTPRIGSLLKSLDEKNITHCYASFWLVYRITFESDEKIVCAPPYNERFLRWPVSYKEEVDKAPNAVYILTQTFGARLDALGFERHLKAYGVGGAKLKMEPFLIYSGFDYPFSGGESVLPPGQYRLRASSGGDEIEALSDEDLSTTWISPVKQKKGQWLEVDFSTSQVITSITLFHLPGTLNSAKIFRILGLENGNGKNEWRILADEIKPSFDRFRFINNHPVYGGMPQNLRFDPARIKALRIDIVEPERHANWGLAEIEIGVQE